MNGEMTLSHRRLAGTFSGRRNTRDFTHTAQISFLRETEQETEKGTWMR